MVEKKNTYSTQYTHTENNLHLLFVYVLQKTAQLVDYTISYIIYNSTSMKAWFEKHMDIINNCNNCKMIQKQLQQLHIHNSTFEKLLYACKSVPSKCTCAINEYIICDLKSTRWNINICNNCIIIQPLKNSCRLCTLVKVFLEVHLCNNECDLKSTRWNINNCNNWIIIQPLKNSCTLLKVFREVHLCKNEYVIWNHV